MMINRHLYPSLVKSLRRFPVVALVGPRQVGKTTLAKQLAASGSIKAIYIDLEKPSDLAKLSEPELYLQSHADKLIILDEIQRMPELFAVLRALVDSKRRAGRFLLLGSASPQLLRQASESLAGRIVYHELTPFLLGEVKTDSKTRQRLWFRGGFPGSFLAGSEDAAEAWREAFIRTYLERDIPQLGIRIPSMSLRRFWEMLAHSHGQLWNASKIAASLGVSAPTVRHYLDILQETYIARLIEPYHANLKKRLVKSPKVYVRDSGLLHSLLRLPHPEDLYGHPAVGASWEGWVIEQILALTPANWRHSFYRSAAGAEIDLLLERPGRKPPIAIEIKFTSAPKPSKGFWSALADLGNVHGYIVCACEENYPLANKVSALPVQQIATLFE